MKASFLQQSVDDFERNYIQRELERNHWNRSQTARDLGISYRGLLYKIDRFHLAPAPTEFSEAS